MNKPVLDRNLKGRLAKGKSIGRKTLDRAGRKIVIRADGHKSIGMGHLYRMLTLARYLREQHGFDISFIVKNNRPALTLIERYGFRSYPLKFNTSLKDELLILPEILYEENPDIIIIDSRKRCHDRSFMEKIGSGRDACVIAFTDVHEKREIASDIVINGSILQKGNNYKNINDTKYYLGFDYVILSPGYLSFGNWPRAGEEVERVMVCMGGADQHNLTFTVLKAIDKSANRFVCDVVLSSAFFEKKSVDNVVKTLRHEINVHYDIDGILDLLLQSDLAITAGGNAHVERMCVGVPGIAISQERHQSASARKIASFGATVDLGIFRGLKTKRLLQAFNSLTEDNGMRERMSKCGRFLVDGKGLIRVSDIIVGACQG